MMNDICKICGFSNWKPMYKGLIRTGDFGSLSKKKEIVWKCVNCKIGFLKDHIEDYESEKYRNLVDGECSAEKYYELHDKEQGEKILLLGTGCVRGKIIADIGCGAGAFLDFFKGVALKTVAVEPAKAFHCELKRKGHEVYPFCSDALADWRGEVDIVTAFAVLEHVSNPKNFLSEMRKLLKPDGILLLSTPNYDDWLLETLPEKYGSFFFRRAHSFYFNSCALENISRHCGFSCVKLKYVQQYDIGNALLWLKNAQPSGLNKIPWLMSMDNAYKQCVENQGKSNFIYAYLRL